MAVLDTGMMMSLRSQRIRRYRLLAIVAAIPLAACEASQDADVATQAVKQPNLLMFSPEWCLKRRADAAAGKVADETPVEKLRIDGICSANLASKEPNQ